VVISDKTLLATAEDDDDSSRVGIAAVDSVDTCVTRLDPVGICEGDD
jgi:hypothetical protein